MWKQKIKQELDCIDEIDKKDGGQAISIEEATSKENFQVSVWKSFLEWKILIECKDREKRVWKMGTGIYPIFIKLLTLEQGIIPWPSLWLMGF